MFELIWAFQISRHLQKSANFCIFANFNKVAISPFGHLKMRLIFGMIGKIYFNWYELFKLPTICKNQVIFANLRISIKLLTIPYHNLPYLPNHTLPYLTVPYHTIPYHDMMLIAVGKFLTNLDRAKHNLSQD